MSNLLKNKNSIITKSPTGSSPDNGTVAQHRYTASSATILIFNVSCFVAGEGDKRASVPPARSDDYDCLPPGPTIVGEGDERPSVRPVR